MESPINERDKNEKDKNILDENRKLAEIKCRIYDLERMYPTMVPSFNKHSSSYEELKVYYEHTISKIHKLEELKNKLKMYSAFHGLIKDCNIKPKYDSDSINELEENIKEYEDYFRHKMTYNDLSSIWNLLIMLVDFMNKK